MNEPELELLTEVAIEMYGDCNRLGPEYYELTSLVRGRRTSGLCKCRDEQRGCVESLMKACSASSD